MTASLYQIGSGSAMRRAPDDEDVRHALGGIELHVVPRPAAGVARAVEQVLDNKRRVWSDAEVGDRHLDPAVLHAVRIGVGHDEHVVTAAGLAEPQQRGVVGPVEAQRLVLLQRRMDAADVVDARDQLLEIARLIDRKSTRLNSSHGYISYAVFCLKKKTKRSSYRT